MKRRIIFITLFLMVLSGCAKKTETTDNSAAAGSTAVKQTPPGTQKTTDKRGSHNGQTGVIIKDTDITYFNPNDYKKYTQTAKKGTLALVLDENKDSYHVQFAVTELPAMSGHISKDSVSFDTNDLQNATSGLVKHANVYNSPKDAKPKIKGYSSAVLIEGKEGNFIKCSLPGGDTGYIKKDDIEYIVEKAEWTVEMLPPEQ